MHGVVQGERERERERIKRDGGKQMSARVASERGLIGSRVYLYV